MYVWECVYIYIYMNFIITNICTHARNTQTQAHTLTDTLHNHNDNQQAQNNHNIRNNSNSKHDKHNNNIIKKITKMQLNSLAILSGKEVLITKQVIMKKHWMHLHKVNKPIVPIAFIIKEIH